MITKKIVSLKAIYEFAGHHLTWLTLWMVIVTSLYYFLGWHFVIIPWLPLSLIGTAVAFYVGFKNNQAYDRAWEGRKIWGAIINNSRMLAAMIKNFRAEGGVETKQVQTEFVHRHIAYLYQLRRQLLEPTQWEHVRLHWIFGTYNQRRQQKLFALWEQELKEVSEREYLTEEEIAWLRPFANKATQLLDRQSALVQQLYEAGSINMMQQMELQRTINNLYDEQGKAERIKKFPLPRQFGSFSFIFVCIFVFLLPFGIVSEFSKLGGWKVWLSVPLGVIVGWVYVVMEMIGDYSENPFEGLANDVPMLSICRTIEIDMLQMLGNEDVPAPIQAKKDVLM